MTSSAVSWGGGGNAWDFSGPCVTETEGAEGRRQPGGSTAVVPRAPHRALRHAAVKASSGFYEHSPLLMRGSAHERATR